jgi:hypothetical protein
MVVLNAASKPFLFEVGYTRFGLVRMTPRSLQKRHQVLGPFVRGQRLVHQAREEQCFLSQLAHNSCLARYA